MRLILYRPLPHTVHLYVTKEATKASLCLHGIFFFFSFLTLKSLTDLMPALTLCLRLVRSTSWDWNLAGLSPQLRRSCWQRSLYLSFGCSCSRVSVPMASLLKVGPLGSVRHPPYTNGLSSKDASAAEDLSCLANQSARHVFLPSYFNQPPKATHLECMQTMFLLEYRVHFSLLHRPTPVTEPQAPIT